MSSVTEFFKDQNVFITGGSGFMGRVLIEKLLRSCPEIGRIYLLLREKNGMDINARVEELLNVPIFDGLKKKYPENLLKLIPVPGDCMELGLGLSDSDRQILEENVSIVFHSAAHVRFDEGLKNAIIINTRGTREVMLLCRKMKKLKIPFLQWSEDAERYLLSTGKPTSDLDVSAMKVVIVHLSTCYSNCDRKVIEEIIYPAPGNWKEYIEIAEKTDNEALNILTAKVIDKRPNTYVFSKALAEHVVKDLGENLPVVIIRPSIVFCSWKEPIPGWVDNLNGPTGFFAASSGGLVHFLYGKSDTVLDCVPVDVVIKIMCIAAWEKAESKKYDAPSLYNVSARDNFVFQLKDMRDAAIVLREENPPEEILWYPSCEISKNKFKFAYITIIQLLLSSIVDQILINRGKKKRVTAIQRRAFNAMRALEYFTSRSWIFRNDNMMEIMRKVPPSDNEFFIQDIKDFNFIDYMRNGRNIGYKFVMREKGISCKEKKKNLERMRWLHRTVKGVGSCVTLWMIYQSGLLPNIVHYIQSTIESWITEIVEA